VELGGEVEYVNADNYTEVIDRLVAKHGGQPRVSPVVDPSTPAGFKPQHSLREQLKAGPVTLTVPAVLPGEIDAVGRDRSNAARLEMKANGFMPAMPIYAVGSRVMQLGVENARSSRLEYDALPLLPQACASLIHTVAREQRKDIVVDRLANVTMTPEGLLRNQGGGVKLSEPAFGGLLSRAGIGGHSYLAKCPPDLRAQNVNYWLSELKFNERADEIQALASKTKFEPKDAKFRTRLNRGEREIFAVVSGSYGAFDADKIATALSMAAPNGARGSIVYDGTRLKAETLFHSNVAPEEFVAGEFFKAGVLVRSDDTGGGSIRISAVVWQNLCLNLIILDECVQPIAAIRHVGSVQDLANKFTVAFAQALNTIEGFLVKWNYAVQEDVGAPAEAATHEGKANSLAISEILPGLFNGIVERELVPVRGQRKDIVQGLVRMYEQDTSAAVVGKDFVSRAAVVNAFTRYAHSVNTDPFEQDAIERSAGRLLNVTRENRVLPFEPIDF
jgi:hypothetical protein